MRLAHILSISLHSYVYSMDSLVGYWPLKENAQDEQGNHHGREEDIKYVSDEKFGSCAFFNGSSYIEIPNSKDFSVSEKGLTVSVWISPSTLNFTNSEKEYVHFLGKGDKENHEWTFRMYNNNSERPNRLSFYVFNLEGGLGAGSYVQKTVKQNEWIHLVGIIDDRFIYLYKNGVLQKVEDYHQAAIPSRGEIIDIYPEHGSAPVRIGTRDLHSFFEGKMADLRIYNSPISEKEVIELYKNKN
ncbi:LamG domain-containing protein [Candidatus Pacearchaeota archaeon]|nr:LamG domain-containing protein [Candidatus Pacearchaeota archaeon]